MKKILALLTVMCMLVALLASCGNAADNYFSTVIGYMEDLADAIDDDDDDAIEDIQDEISDWAKENQDAIEDVTDKYEDDYEDAQETFNDILADDDIKDSAKSALRDFMTKNSSVRSMARSFYDTATLEDMLEMYIDAAADLKDADSDDIKDTAKDLAQDCEDILDEYEELSDSYQEEAEALEDDYDDEVIAQAAMLFSTALMK